MTDRKKLTAIINTAVLSVIALTIPVGVKLLERGYRFPRAQAAPQYIYFSPDTGTHRVGEPFIVQVMINTEGERIDGLDLALRGVNLEIVGEVTPLPIELDRVYGPDSVLNNVYSSILADASSGFSNNENLALMELSVKGLAHCAESRITLNPDLSVVAANGRNVLNAIPDAVYNIETPPDVLNPRFTSSSNIESQVGETFYYKAEATNPNNTYLDFQYSNVPDWLTANGPELRGVPPATGVYELGVIVSDSAGGSACMTLTITVVDLRPIEISNIVVAPITHDAVTISWETNRPATSIVKYGKTSEYDNLEVNNDLDQNHSITLHDLEPSTVYHYLIASADPQPGGDIGETSDRTFTTQPAPTTRYILHVNLKMEGKRPKDNDHPVIIYTRDQSWGRAFIPHGDGYYPLPIEATVVGEDRHLDLLLKGYQHLAVRREVDFPEGETEWDVDFKKLPTGDIGPRFAPDNFVNTIDYSVWVSEIGVPKPSIESIADLNSDGAVNTIDYSLMINNYNKDGES